LTFGTTRVEGRQPNAPAAFTPGEIPGTHFQRLSWPQGTWFCQKELQEKSQVTPLGIDSGTVRLVAQRLNHYTTPGPYIFHVSCTNATQGNKISWWAKLIFHHKWSFGSSAISTQLSWNRELTLILVNYRICNKDCVPPLTAVLTNLSVCIYVFIILSKVQYHCSSLGQTRVLTSHLQQLGQCLVHVQMLPGGVIQDWTSRKHEKHRQSVRGQRVIQFTNLTNTCVYTWKFIIRYTNRLWTFTKISGW
jgi:hypothetical protein